MTQSLSLAEITEAITLLPKGKALGHDGIPTIFFQEYVNEVAPMLLLAFKAMLARGLTSEYINKGMITLIPKSGDHSKLGNCRPITLLGSIYKSLAKTLAERIQEFLPLALEEKGQYMTNTFTTTCNYLVFATKILPSTTNVTSC